ncbi:hypothetical protein A9Q91_01095 [Candidatus Gracilibacteria bacterium 28_42_T64]|nr:hypothetical protein A9Q91_01095 [Candidatus Gracilibacteria bacterium 28_42_T64]
MSKTVYPGVYQHRRIEEIKPDVFFLQGSVQIKPGLNISRNMTILRQNGELTLINAVRLDTVGLKELESLGKITYVVKIGHFHGMDDRYYLDTYGAKFCCLDGVDPQTTPKQNVLLKDGDIISGAKVLVFNNANEKECVLLLPEHEGILITCDSIQYFHDTTYMSWFAKIMLPLLGFKKGMLLGPPWLKTMTPKGSSLQSDFERILQEDFKIHISAHWGYCDDDVQGKIRMAIDNAFPKK